MLKILKPTRIHHLRAKQTVCAPASGPAHYVMALCYLGVTVIMELECSWQRQTELGAEGWFPWKWHQHLNDFLSQQVGDLMSSSVNSKGKPKSGWAPQSGSSHSGGALPAVQHQKGWSALPSPGSSMAVYQKEGVQMESTATWSGRASLLLFRESKGIASLPEKIALIQT